MTLQEVLNELQQMGNEQTRKTWANHGATGAFFGVKVGDMKVIQKKVKHNHELALGLYRTGNSDAMYLAGLISEPRKMSKAELEQWAENATWYMVTEYTVAWTAAESLYGRELAVQWIHSGNEKIATAGWSTYSSLVAIKKDEELDIEEIKELLELVGSSIHQAPNRVRYTMNNFVISVGSYVSALMPLAKKVAAGIGKVSVEMGGTACKVPDALSYIEKVESMGRIGKKRKTAFC